MRNNPDETRKITSRSIPKKFKQPVFLNKMNNKYYFQNM